MCKVARSMKVNERDQLRDLDIDVRIILTWILLKVCIHLMDYSGSVWTSCGFLWTQSEPSCSLKGRIFWLAEHLFAVEGLCCVLGNIWKGAGLAYKWQGNQLNAQRIIVQFLAREGDFCPFQRSRPNLKLRSLLFIQYVGCSSQGFEANHACLSSFRSKNLWSYVLVLHEAEGQQSHAWSFLMSTNCCKL